MKKNHKILGGFIACLHCCLMALPLLTLLYNVGRHCLQANLSYEVTYTYDSEGNYSESSREYTLAEKVELSFKDTLADFNYIDTSYDYSQHTWSDNFAQTSYPFLMNNDFMGLFSISSNTMGDSAYTYVFINMYLNWIINMSVIVFVPELICVFIDICRKLIYSFSHKIEGGF